MLFLVLKTNGKNISSMIFLSLIAQINKIFCGKFSHADFADNADF